MTENSTPSAATGVEADNTCSVYPFHHVNQQLWQLPTAESGEVDWDAVRCSLEESPEEGSNVVGRYFLSWLNPYVTFVSRERMEDAYMPLPQRRHRAVYCGALLSRAFHEEQVRGGRDAWHARVEAAAPGEDGAVRVARANALAGVQFRGEACVRGRLRWLGYLRSSDTPHVLLGGVEWDGDAALPAYRARHASAGRSEAVVHDGCVHGERLFYQVCSGGGMRCTCEYLRDLVPLSEDGAVVTGVATPRAPSLLVALFRTFKADLLAMLGPSAVGLVCEVATPWLLQQFVLFLQSNKSERPLTKGIAMFAVFCVVMLTKPVVFNKQMHRGRRTSSLFRAATLGVIFEKCLTISPDALSQPEMSTGRILTMASSDMENIKEFPMQVMFLWVAPIMLTLYLIYLFTLVGWSTLAGLAVFLISLPVQTALTRLVGAKQRLLTSCTDQRLRRTNELLSGIRVVKMMGWEPRFLSAIEDDSRKAELQHRKNLQLNYVVLWGCLFSTPPFMIAAILTIYTLSGNVLNASIVLPVIAVVSAVTYPIMMLPEAFTSLAKFIVSTGRITQFLECDDSHITVEHTGEIFEQHGGAGAFFSKATVMASVPTALPAYEPRHRGLRHALSRVVRALLRRPLPVELQWTRTVNAPAATVTPAQNSGETGNAAAAATADEGEGGGTLYAMEDKPLLRDVCVLLPRGQLTVVVGATGSGKSVLLSTLLGAFRFRGRVGVLPSIAYVPQQPWIMQETVRANITFFEGDRRSVDERNNDGLEGFVGNARLKEAVRCCQLEADLPLLPKGLSTEIGEKGVNLSGGQKARVSLARAVYADCDVYVLDDPLSALDAHVGRHVMEEVVLRALAGKTRVLVTHQLHVLPYADQVVVVRDGCVAFSGSYSAYAESTWKAYVENEEEKAVAIQRSTGSALVEEEEFNEFSPFTSPLFNQAPCFGSSVSGSRDVIVTRKERSLTSFSEGHRDLLERSMASEHSKHSCIMSRHVNATASSLATEGDELEDDDDAETTEASLLRRHCSRGTTIAANDYEAPRTMREATQKKRHPPVTHHRRLVAEEVVPAVSREVESELVAAAPLITAEEKETGHIPYAVYQRYCTAGGGVALAVAIVAFYLFAEVIATTTNVWLTLWSVQQFAGVLTAQQQLIIYLNLTICLQVVKVLNDTVFFVFVRRASRRLHATLLYTVSSATLTFFDRTPLGRVINRFSKDIYTLDDELPSCTIPLLQVAGFLTTSLSVTMYTSPLTIVVVVIAGYVFVRLLQFYTTVVREVRRRGSVVQSPLFSLLEEVVQGRATIAAYGKSHALFAEALRRLDLVYSCTYMEKAVTLWLAIRIEYIAAAMIIVVGLIGVVEKVVDASPVMSEERVGLISLSLTMCLDLSWSLSSLISLAAVVEASMNSVQRVCHYIDHVPQEALLLEPGDAYVAAALGRRGGAAVPPSARARDVAVVDGGSGCAAAAALRGSPEFGSLRLEHVDMRYRPGLPLVLRDVCFAIAPGQKVGVVGRTGSGKSTLLLAFLRLVEVCGGRMVVCGRDAQTYTLPALRRLFSMIPQDPVLFDGTIRSNVDPFGDATDAEVRAALASVGFVSGGDRTSGGTNGGGAGGVPALETVVQEGGSNFSVGQRQLLCLARALLKKGNAFILMDEATANVDARLDQTVQRVVAEQFRDYTVVTIAHRLHTVASYDMILVMAHGRVVECGSPRSLLGNRASAFFGMVAQSSAVMSAVAAGGGGAEGVDAGGQGREGGAGAGGLSAEERERRVEEVVAAFMKDCKEA
ncbi:p-glycoprotein-like protein [Lotmaria passim]